MIRRSTWVFIVILAALIGLAWYLNRANSQAESTATTSTPKKTIYLFSSDEGFPNDIHLKNKAGDEVEVKRGNNGEWMMLLPKLVQADSGIVEAAATQVTTLQVLNTLEIDPQAVELQPPDYTLSVIFSNGGQHQVKIGTTTPTQSGYYVQEEDGTIAIVDQAGMESLLNLLTNPPYAPTATPTLEATSLPPAIVTTPQAITPTP
jgi:hypothetical protein